MPGGVTLTLQFFESGDLQVFGVLRYLKNGDRAFFVFLAVVGDTDDFRLAGLETLVGLHSRVCDGASEIASVNGWDHTAHGIDLVDDGVGFCFDFVGEFFDEVAAGERIDGLGDVGFVGEDLLGSQGDLDGLLAWQGESFVHAVGVQGLHAAEDGCEGLVGDADDVVHRLLFGEGDAGGLRVRSQQPASFVFGVESIAHGVCPDASCSAELGDFLEEVVVHIEEKAEARGKGIDVEPPLDRVFHIFHAVRKRESEFLGCGRTGFADVVATDRNGVPLRHVLGAIFDGVDDEFDARVWWIDVFVLCVEFLEDVVLQGASELVGCVTLFFGDADIESEEDGCGCVDGHGRADVCEIDVVEEATHVVQ